MGWAAKANKSKEKYRPVAVAPRPKPKPMIVVRPLDVYTNWQSMAPMVLFHASRIVDR